MGLLPTSRDLTISPSDPIPSSLLNALQDCIVGLKHPSLPLPLDIMGAYVWGAGSTVSVNNTGGGRYLLITSPVADISFPIRLPVGTRITNLVLGYNREASANFGISLVRTSVLTGIPTIVASLIDNASAGDTTKDLAVDATSGALPYITAANETIGLDLSGATNARIYGAIVTVDRL